MVSKLLFDKINIFSKYFKCSHADPIIPSSISISSLRLLESLSDRLTFLLTVFLGLVDTDFLVSTGSAS